MPVRLVITSLVAAMVAVPSAAMGQDQSLQDVRTSLREGDRVRIVDTSGVTSEGRLDRLSDGAFLLKVRGKTLTIPDTQVVQVKVPRREGDGVLIGLGVGAATGLAFVQHECRDTSERRDCLGIGRVVIAVPMAIVGALVDLGFKRYTTVFNRTAPQSRLHIAPVLGRHHKGLALTISF